MRLILDRFLARDDIGDSPLERAFADLCRVHGLVGFVRQFRPPWYDGSRGIVDNAHLQAKLIVETDGRAWHTISQAMRDDRQRDRTAVMHGWRVVRYDYDEVVHRPDEVANELRRLISLSRAA
jgi:very-short-patch-repair endonuclease